MQDSLLKSCVILAVACVTVVCSTKCGQVYDSSGVHFMIGVPSTGYNAATIYFYMTSKGSASTNVTVIAPYLNVHKQITFHESTFFSLNVSHIQIANTTEFKGIELTSNVPISVTVMTSPSDYMEGYLALPVPTLGTTYIAAAYKPYSSYTSELMIVGVSESTMVTIRLPSKYGRKIIVKELQKFESYLFSGSYDVSGTIVETNKPVAVISGSEQSRIPIGKGDRQYIVEQMIPTNLWNYEYIVPPLYPRLKYLIRIFAKENHTNVSYVNKTRTVNTQLDKAEYIELVFEQEATYVTANKPINIVQYGYEENTAINGDPFMMNSQAVSQFQQEYIFRTQNVYSLPYNTVAITIKYSDLPGLLFDNSHNAISSGKSIPVPSPKSDYINVYLNVSYGTFYSLRHTSNKTFGAVIYGAYTTSEYIYGHSLPMTFTVNSDCDNFTTPIELTTQPVYTGQPIYTGQPSHSGHNTSLAYHGNRTECFNCDEMSTLRYCDNVKVCQPNEVCYVQSIVTNTNNKHFKSGCTLQSNCNSQQQSPVGVNNCYECCTGSHCNSHGCGDRGVLDMANRGPYCYDCRRIGTQKTCEQVTICKANQVCIVEKFQWGDEEEYFSMGCSDPLASHCSNTKRSVPVDGGRETRNVPVCIHCCHGDFCNHNCTGTEHNLAIVG